MQRPTPLILVFWIFVNIAITATTMAAESGAGSNDAAVHIIYCEKPQGEEPEAFHIRTLTSVLGSEDAAKDAMLYSYKTAASGFSAKLTPDQVSQISKEPGVLQVVPSQTYQLHSGTGKLH